MTLAELRANGLRITLDGDRIKAGPASLLTVEFTRAIRQNKAALLAELQREHIEDVQSFYEERAAIMEHDGGLTRQEAEALAVERTAVKFTLTEAYGNPPEPGGGYLIGKEGATVEDLKTELTRRYGKRLESVTEH